MARVAGASVPRNGVGVRPGSWWAPAGTRRPLAGHHDRDWQEEFFTAGVVGRRRMSANDRQSGIPTQLVLGALVILVGVVLLLDTTGVYETRPLLEYVPALFILLGVYALWRGGLRNFFGPLIVIVLASAWQLAAVDIVEWEELWDFWPVFLIFFGLSLVLSVWRRTPGETSANHVSSFAIFGGSEKRSNSKEFSGADLTALFGGAELDLRDAAVADPPARISAIAMFGGVEVTVPRDWNVQLEVLPIFGGASDERPHRPEEHETVDLVVSGFAAFGGVGIND